MPPNFDAQELKDVQRINALPENQVALAMLYKAGAEVNEGMIYALQLIAAAMDQDWSVGFGSPLLQRIVERAELMLGWPPRRAWKFLTGAWGAESEHESQSLLREAKTPEEAASRLFELMDAAMREQLNDYPGPLEMDSGMGRVL